MKQLFPSMLKDLLSQKPGPSVSLFLPTHRQAGMEIQQDPTLLKQLLREAEQRLFARGWSEAIVKQMLQPLRKLLDDQQLWQHPEEGLAILRSLDVCSVYQLPARFQAQVRVADHFSLKPLLPFLTTQKRCYLLALSQNEVRFLEATPFGVQELQLPEEVPTSLAEALRSDETENLLEGHSVSSGDTIGKGGYRPFLYHGQGVGKDEQRHRLLHYCQLIDRGLHELLHEEQAPLLLACVEFMQPIYQQANTYPHLLPSFLAGNPDKQSPQALRDRAWAIVEPHLAEVQRQALRRYQEPEDLNLVSQNVTDIVLASFWGKVETLFVAIDQTQWGQVWPQETAIVVHEQEEAGDDDLLDLAARQTLLHRGTVYALPHHEMPSDTAIAAIFRYS